MEQIIFLTIYVLFILCNNEEIVANESMNVCITPRILGGNNADMALHSYTLTLRNRGEYFCTAFAVSEEDILTSGHCFNPDEYFFPPYPDVTVHSGTSSPFELGIIHEIEKITVHPNYDIEWESSGNHDIAHILLKENSRLTVGENQRILGLPRQDVESLDIGVMTGWGCTNLNTPNVPAATLQMLQMRMLNYTDCQEYVPHRTLYKEQLCAFNSRGRGCAVGDSGGPLVVNNVAVGIHSWCQKGKRGLGYAEVFANVFQELGFLNSVMRTNNAESSPSTSTSSSSSSEPDVKRKKVKRESTNRIKSSWFRRVMCLPK